MKKVLIPILLLFVTLCQAQLTNSWIDNNKTYYKFKIGQAGVYRINQPLLATLGLGNITSDQFQLWRNGVEVSIYTSQPNGSILSPAGFIEFLGEKNDGKPDNTLYKNATYQLSDSFSLFSDTATYFLTVNPAGNNLRINLLDNNVSGTTLAPDLYFMRKIRIAYNNKYNPGFGQNAGEYVYSSSYDMGEGYTTNDIYGGFDQSFNNLNVFPTAPDNSSFYIAAFGNSPNLRNLKVKFGSTVLFDDVAMNSFSIVKKQVDNIPISAFSNPDNLIINTSGYLPPPGIVNAYSRIVVGEMILTYPSKFNFNNSNYFYFELKASPAGNYLIIDNFNIGSVPPVLYCITDGQKLVGDISVSGKVRFALPGSNSTLRKFYLANEETANVNIVNTLTSTTFLNFNDVNNQGDYLIISHPSLFNDGQGVNYVEQYKQYRASAAGGGFNVKIININELDDQFGFGIKKHPVAIRDFIRFASSQFKIQPKYIFIIGRGLNSIEYRQNETNPITAKIDLVQTFGWPASDVMLACLPGLNVPLVPIGRLAVINGTEIKYYLNKVKQYELAEASPSQTIADKGWMKNIINVSGGGSADETDLFGSYLDGYKRIAEDSLFGGKVETFVKASASAVEQASGIRIEQLINNGVGLIQYFGHSSANTFAFNLNNPEVYTNVGKYPFFSVSGCDAGNFYIFDANRLQGNLTLSEKYVLADQRGSIGFIASTHFGIPNYLDLFNRQLYTNFSRTLYGNTIGNQLKKTLQYMGGSNPQALNYYTRIHMEEMNLHGDPAIRIYSFAKPDFVVEDQMVKLTPNIITVADKDFTINIKMQNIGKAINDSMRVYVTRTLPDNTIKILYNKTIAAVKFADSLSITIPIFPLTDKGLNKITVFLDADNRIDELSESNNILTKEFYILEDEIRPVFPYNYSIVNKQKISFTASTANPLIGQRQYVMELDTTELFNSSFKKQYTKNGTGGIIEFVPDNITFSDSVVYYWRTSMVPLNGAQQIWNSFSFIYLPNGGSGYNQSHYYQHQKSNLSSNITFDADGIFRYKSVPRILNIKTGIYPNISYETISVNLDFEQITYYGCGYSRLQFIVYDTNTLKPWVNTNSTNVVTGEQTGRFGSSPVCRQSQNTGFERNFFEFAYDDIIHRKRIMDFIDSIPDGMYFSVTNFGASWNTTFINDWQADQNTLGSGNSLYHKFKTVGFNQIDSFSKNLPFIFFSRKNYPSFASKQKMGSAITEQLDESYSLRSKFTSGTIESPLFGPARSFSALHWYGKSVDPILKDSVSIQVIGVTLTGTEKLLASVAPATDTTLSFIDATQYPYVKLKMINNDATYATPNQLKYWRINADYVPEGAVAPNILYKMKDTVEQGEKIDFALAFKNISTSAFDSLNVKFIITDHNNAPHPVAVGKKKALLSGDTLSVTYSIDTKNYPGQNTLYLMVNPDNNQPEQYSFNNFIYKNFFVKEDKFNPLLDVTFDGVHILNRDIIASKPHVLIKLKDESHFLALNDTALLKLQVRYPDGTLHNYFFSDTVRFSPANLATGQNTATIDFLPFFPIDGDYQFIVSGKDVVGNKAGKLEYRVTFSVINKPMISNLLNYPNPFTTSTAFVFTITGSEVPQNIRIQILTITGKVVREITKDELGPIHIGRNITDFKWDGTDVYGQKLANGVYLYRVITNLNGKSLDKYVSDGDKTDKYFNKGYGKMYLMR